MNSRLTMWFLLALTLAGCASEPQRPAPAASPTLQRIAQALSAGDTQAPSAPGVPAAVDSALLPPVRLQSPAATAPAPREPRFDLSVAEAEARSFFMGLVRGSRYNMVVHPSVSGTITLELNNVTVGEVMRTVRDVYGYEFERRDNGYIVMPKRLRSQIFNVSYVNLQRSGQSTTRVASGQVSDAGDSTGDQSGNSATRTIGSEIVTTTEASFWSRIGESVRAIVGGGEGRSVVVSAQAGLIVVRAMPNELRDVGNFLASAQTSLHKQVILEAKVVEVQLNDASQSGINWAALGSNSTGGLTFGQSAIMDGASVVLDDNLGFDSSALTRPGTVSGFPFGGMFAIGAASDEFAALITLLNTQGEAQVLSSPRVATINNQKAVIKVGSDEFFVTEVESTTTTGTATTTTPKITLTPFFSGIALDVTPHVTVDNEVILHIHPTVSEVEDQTKNITVAGQTQTLPLAFSSVRESDSIVRARNGQVVVIGGLMQDRTRKETSKTPFFGDLPVVGKLFQQDRDVSSRSELVILLRPMVIDRDLVWREDLGEVARRVDGLYSPPQQ